MKIVSLFLLLGLSINVAFAREVAMDRKLQEQLQWQIVMAHLVAYQPKHVGWERYATSIGLKSYTSPGAEYFKFVRGNKVWPTVSMEGNALKFTSEGLAPVTLELVDRVRNEFLLNGKIFFLDPKQSLIKQVKAALEWSGKSSSIFSLIPEAHAGDGVNIAFTTIGSAAGILASIASAAAIGTGVAANIVGVGGIAAAVGSLYCSFDGSSNFRPNWHGETFGQRYLNCITHPLSLVGMNPRDRLYLSGIRCGSNDIRVTVKSVSGLEQTRMFKVSDDGRLEKIELYDQDKSVELMVSKDEARIENGITNTGRANANGKLTRSKNTKQLNEAQVLLGDYQVYKSTCADKEKLRVLNHMISAEKAPRSEYETTTEQLNKSAQ